MVGTPHNKTHGLSLTPTYNSWHNMIGRCYNTANVSYYWYGNKGVKVCDRWREPNGQGFMNFLADMGERPMGKTLDRIDSTADYSPENCRWATPTEQNYNRTLTRKNKTGERNINFTANGKRFALFMIVNKRKQYIATFGTLEEAVRARDTAEREKEL